MLAGGTLSCYSATEETDAQATLVEEKVNPTETTIKEPAKPDFVELASQLKGASPAEKEKILKAWKEKNIDQLEARKQWQKQLAASRSPAVVPIVEDVIIPENASKEMEEFLVERAKLQNSMKETWNALGNASTAEKAASLENWKKEHQTQIEDQRKREMTVAVERANIPLNVPSQLVIQEQVTPEVKKLLEARNAILKQIIAKEEEIQKLPLEEQAKAMRAYQSEQIKSLRDTQKTSTQLSPAS